MKTEDLIKQLELRITSMKASSIRKDDPLIDLLEESVRQLQDYIILEEDYWNEVWE